jgi:integrase
VAKGRASGVQPSRHRYSSTFVARSRTSYLTNPTPWCFPGHGGGLLSIEEYRRAFDRACAEIGIEGLVPHGLRHTTASLAISAGANVKVVQRMLRHATAAMTLDLYGHLLDDDLTGVADALGKATKALR